MVFALALALRLPTFVEPWVGVHNAWGGAFYGNVARNFLRYGMWTTAFAPVVNSGVVEPSQFEVYFHHPVLSMWLTAVSFSMFGIHEWSARLMPLLFSMLTIVMVFRIALATASRSQALMALVIMAVLPVDTYYSAHLDPNNSISIFFTVFAVDAYRRWSAGHRRGDFVQLAVALAMGCLSGWFTYLVIPGLVLHGWFSRPAGERRAVIVSLAVLPAISIAVFGLFLLHRKIALAGIGPEVFDALSDRLLKRTVSLQAGRVEILKAYLHQLLSLYTLPMVGLSIAWLIMFAGDLRRGAVSLGEWCVVLLWSYGFLYAMAFPGHLLSHDFFVRPYAAGVALAAASVLYRAGARITTPSGHAAFLGSAIALIGVVTTLQTRALFNADDRFNGTLLRGFGEAVASRSTLRDPVFLPIRDDRVLQYYVDRPLTFDLSTPERLADAARKVRGPFLILVADRNWVSYPELTAYLQKTYPEQRTPGLHIFLGNRPPGN